jgi:EmrB/QacA subfamily drug resistance transporter
MKEVTSPNEGASVALDPPSVPGAAHREAAEVAVEAVPAAWGDVLSRRRIIAVLVSVMLGMLLSALDQTVVGTAMPRIIADLNGLQHYAWVGTAYLLASAASMPIWGKLSDAFGRRRFFMVGMAIFLVGSVLCGQSQNMTELVAFRALQGLGAGAMMPIVQAILGDIFPPAQRARWTGLLMSVFGLATIVGPLIGGYITDNIGWRWTFYVNLPVGIVALVCAYIALPAHVKTRKHKIDYLGAALLVAAAVPLLLGFSWAGSEFAWVSPEIIGLFLFSAVMWVVFLLQEFRASEPVLSPRLFKNDIFSVSIVAVTLQSAAMFGAIMFLPLFVQGVQGQTATNSGIILMPMMMGAIAASIGGGQLLARTGKYKAVVIAGFVAVVLGTYLLSRMGPDVSRLTLTRDMVILGIGLGVGMSAFTVIVQNQFTTERLGEVTAGLQFFRSLGATVGLAVFGTILNSTFNSSLAANMPSELAQVAGSSDAMGKLDNPQVLLSEQARSALSSSFEQFGAQGAELFGKFMEAVRLSLHASISDLFFLATVIGAVGLVVTLFLREDPLRRTHSLTQPPASR